MVTVNWSLLSGALKWYESRGFRQVSLPWHTRKEVNMITCPEPSMCFDLPGFGGLVGSAEQSFMERHFDGMLEPGRWVSLTPCFRNEPVFDETHLPYFMKVELYSNELEETGDRALEFAILAKKFMDSVGVNTAQIVDTNIGYDLEINGIEVGSYSTRSHKDFVWTCGTGLAEPRFSFANRE